MHARARVREVVVDEHVVEQRRVPLPLVPLERGLRGRAAGRVSRPSRRRRAWSPLPGTAVGLGGAQRGEHPAREPAAGAKREAKTKCAQGSTVQRRAAQGSAGQRGRDHTRAPEFAVSPSTAMALPPMPKPIFPSRASDSALAHEHFLLSRSRPWARDPASRAAAAGHPPRVGVRRKGSRRGCPISSRGAW